MKISVYSLLFVFCSLFLFVNHWINKKNSPKKRHINKCLGSNGPSKWESKHTNFSIPESQCIAALYGPDIQEVRNYSTCYVPSLYFSGHDLCLFHPGPWLNPPTGFILEMRGPEILGLHPLRSLLCGALSSGDPHTDTGTHTHTHTQPLPLKI